jgi:hypothetical protein
MNQSHKIFLLCWIYFSIISANSIGAGGAKAVAEALKVNSTLQTIYLYSNIIGDEGAKAIAEALKVNSNRSNASRNSFKKRGQLPQVHLRIYCLSGRFGSLTI